MFSPTHKKMRSIENTSDEKSKLGKGHAINSQSQEIILNVFNYLVLLFPSKNKKDIYEEVHSATKISIRKVKEIIRGGAMGVSSPKKTKNRGNIYDFDAHDKDIISTKMNEFHQKKVNPVYRDMFNMTKDEENLSFKDCSEPTYRKILRKMGVHKENTQELARKILMERPDIREKRKKYLNEKLKLEKEHPESAWIFLDETYIHKYLNSNKILLFGTEIPKVKIPISKGLRFTIIHAGYHEGWVNGACDVFINTEINGNIFEKWLIEKLFPNIPEKSIIVLDNASIHSRIANKLPTMSNNKNDMKSWLISRNIEFPEKLKKQQLLDLINANTTEQFYFVDNFIRENGHIPIRLPPYHCHLNPIEPCWGQSKIHFKKNNLNNFDDRKGVLRLINESLNNVKPENWRNYIRKSEDFEKEHREKDGIIEQNDDSLIINFTESDYDSEYESDFE